MKIKFDVIIMCSLKISQSSCRVIILPSEEIIKKSLHFIFGSHSTPLWSNMKMFWKFTSKHLQLWFKTMFHFLCCIPNLFWKIYFSLLNAYNFFLQIYFFPQCALLFCKPGLFQARRNTNFLPDLFNWIIFLICVTSITWKYIQRNSK